MDLSGSMQGAGGVGGLLSVHQHSTDSINNSPITDNYFPAYDGNGNVSEYVDSTGAVVAHYEYDAFGQVVASGTKANDFTHQFSTKQLDAESGLHYYGYRYYDAGNGRWLGRDPIGENGGLNVYGFIQNNPLTLVDRLGLDAVYIPNQNGNRFVELESIGAKTIEDMTVDLVDHGKNRRYQRVKIGMRLYLVVLVKRKIRILQLQQRLLK